MARDDAWRLAFKRKERLREKERIRQRKMHSVKITTYKWVALASVALAAAAGTMMYIRTRLEHAFDPYNNLLKIIAALQISIFVCIPCFTFCIVTRETCSQFYFAMGLLAMAMFNLLLGTFGLMVLYVNPDTPYSKDPSNFEDYNMRLGYVISAFLGMALLFGGGVLGLRLFSLSEENYYEDKRRKFECCFKFQSADSDEETELLSAQQEEASAPHLDATGAEAEGASASPSISALLALQQHQRVVDSEDTIHFWDLQALVPVFDVTIETLEQSVSMCAEKSKGMPTRDTEGKLVPTYPPVTLLPRAWLREEVWVQHLWATALALAFIESELPDGPLASPIPRATFRALVRMRHPAQHEQAEPEEGDEQVPEQEEEDKPGLQLDVEAGLPGLGQQGGGREGRGEVWFEAVLQAVDYMDATLIAAREKRGVRTHVLEWVNVACEWTAQHKAPKKKMFP